MPWTKYATPVKKVARMVKRKLDNVLTYCKQPFTNATAEGQRALPVNWSNNEPPRRTLAYLPE